MSKLRLSSPLTGELGLRMICLSRYLQKLTENQHIVAVHIWWKNKINKWKLENKVLNKDPWEEETWPGVVYSGSGITVTSLLSVCPLIISWVLLSFIPFSQFHFVQQQNGALSSRGREGLTLWEVDTVIVADICQARYNISCLWLAADLQGNNLVYPSSYKGTGDQRG